MKSRYLLAIGALAALAAQASAAQSIAAFESLNQFTLGFGGDAAADMAVSVDAASGPYNNFAGYSTGDGVNSNVGYDQSISGLTGYVYAQAESSASAGSAGFFQGCNYFLWITNNSPTGAQGTFEIDSLLERLLGASGQATATAFGGIQVYSGPDYPASYYTQTLDGAGNLYVGATGNFADDGNSDPSNGYYEATGSMSGVLDAGQTVEVQIWASGETHVVPEPATLSFGLIGLAAFIKKRRK